MERVKAQDTLRHLTGREKRALAEYLRRLKEEYGDTVVRVVSMVPRFGETVMRSPILDDAERFVARLEKYLGSVKAIE